MNVPHSLAHSSNSHSDALRLNLDQFFGRHSLSLVPNFYMYLARLVSNLDDRSLTSRMAMDVCQTLLHETKYDQFYLAWKSFKIFGNA